MKKTFIIFLFIIFSSSFSLAKDGKKITIEEIEYSLIGLAAEENFNRWRIEKRKSKTYKKRLKLSKHLRGQCSGSESVEQCASWIIMRVFRRTEQGETRRPGDIFYALSAINALVFNEKTRMKFVGTGSGFKGSDEKMYYTWSKPGKYNKSKGVLIEVYPETKCIQWLMEYGDNDYLCSDYSKKIKKRVEQFKKDPNNEKVLGKPLIKHIKNVRLISDIRKNLGTNNMYLVGDMLNSIVVDVKKNEIRPNLKKRKVLLKKYTLKLSDIKKKLDENNYKSIEKDVSKLSRNYNKLKTLKPISIKLNIKIDEAINIISNVNKLIEISTLNAKNNKKEKLLALASIDFMQTLIDMIFDTIPKSYYAVTKELDRDLFDDDDLAELKVIIDNMIKNNNTRKSAKLTSSINIINKHINTFDILDKLEKLGIKNKIFKSFTEDSAAEVAKEQIRENLNNELFKDIKKLVQNIDKDNLSEISKEASKISNEISSDPSIKNSVSNNVVDRKFGGQSLKTLIAASRR